MKWQIALERVEVTMCVGICEHEIRAQRIWVDVSLDVDYPHAPKHISECVDYASIYNHIQQWASRPHTDLLETLAHELATWLLEEFALVSRACVKIAKPDIFEHAQQVAVQLELTR